MISFETTLSTPLREAGVVYTKPWMVELVLDLAGYLPEKRLADLVALEPSAGDGAFLSAMVRRLVESCARAGTDLRAVREHEGRVATHGGIFDLCMVGSISRPFARPGRGSIPANSRLRDRLHCNPSPPLKILP